MHLLHDKDDALEAHQGIVPLDTTESGIAPVFSHAVLHNPVARNAIGFDPPGPTFRLSFGVFTCWFYGPNGECPDTDAYSWSPDMTRVVADRSGWYGGDHGPDAKVDLRLFNVATGQPTTLLTSAPVLENPQWSPSGSLIAFESHFGNADAIEVIRPDGTGRRAVATAPQWNTYLQRAEWSPDSAYLAYTYKSGTGARDIYRVTVSGTGSTNLTKDIDNVNLAVGWR